MRKLFAITLLAVYLFNLVGYSALFQYFIDQSDKQLVQQLDDNQYSDHELTEVKMALHLPYMTSWADYERVDGEIVLNGIYYNYVKRKVSNDTLYLMCVPNESKIKLLAARNNYASQANDIPSGEKSKEAAAKKSNLTHEYNQLIAPINISAPALFTKQETSWLATDLINSFIVEIYHPPSIHC